MRDFLYDLRRTLSGKFTIIMIALIVLLTVAVAFASVSTSSSSSVPPSSTAYLLPAVFEDNGSYRIVDYAVNGYGQPVPNLQITSLLVNESGIAGGSSAAVNRYVNGTTDSHGYFNTTISSSSSYQEYQFDSEYVDGVNVSQGFIGVGYDKGIGIPGTGALGFEIYGSENFTIWLGPVYNQSNQAEKNVLLHYVSNSNSPLPYLGIYYNVSANGFTNGFTFPESENNMTYYKSIGGVDNAIITLPLNRSANNNVVDVELFDHNGTFVAGTIDTLYSTVSASSFIEGFLEIPFEFLIPILGIFSAYFYYGKDKASGVLESIITRPVTKGRVLVSRFTGGALSFLAGILIALALADIIVFRYTGSLLSTSSFVSILVGYTAEAIGFSGLIYLVSQFSKSQGAILGIGIALFFILSLFWTDLMDVVLFEFHANLATKSGLVQSIILDSISPSYYPTLVLSYHTGYLSQFFGLVGSNVTAASVGITLVSVAVVGIIWIVVPSLASFFLARSRD